MAYTALPTQPVSPLTINDIGNSIGNDIVHDVINDSNRETSAAAAREKINFTTLSMFQACVLTGLIAVPIWAAIGLMLAR